MSIGSYINQKFDSLKAGWLLEQIASMPNKHHLGAVADRIELESACRLLYTEYRRKQYCPASALGLHYNRHMFASEARTFIISDKAKLLGTLSVFPDSPAGVPSEELYGEEIANFRQEKIKFAEVGLLATDLGKVSGYSLSSPEKMQIVFSLFKIMVNYVEQQRITHLVILVNPRHERLYRFLGFKVFADVRSYHGACGAPALPMILELAHFKTRRSTKRWFLENRFPPQLFNDQLAGSPNAFAEMFGESYHAFNDRYNRRGPSRVRTNDEAATSTSASPDTVKISAANLRNT